MPVNIVVGLVSLLVALVLYSIATWGAFRRRGFTPRLVSVLWVGLVFDALATVMMGLSVGGLDLRPGVPLVHTILALLAMAGMFLAAVFGTYAVVSGNEDVGGLWSRVIVAPWLLWVVVFVWGMATRGAARLGG